MSKASEIITAAVLGDHLGVSERTIADRGKRGIVVKASRAVAPGGIVR